VSSSSYRNRAQALEGAYRQVRDDVRRKLELDPEAHYVRSERAVSPLPNGRWQVSVGGSDTDPGAFVGMHGMRREQPQPGAKKRIA